MHKLATLQGTSSWRNYFLTACTAKLCFQTYHPPTENTHVGQAKDRKKGGVYEAPTYRVKRRTGLNFITTFQLRTEDDKSKWTLRGVALLGSID